MSARRGRSALRRACASGLVVVAMTAIAGCGGGGLTTTSFTPTPPVQAPVPAGLTDAERRAFLAGRDVAGVEGCMACHRIGAMGADAPGNDLTGIGARRSASEIRAALADPPARMHRYVELAREDLDALVAFLVALGAPGGGESCPGESDCG